MFYGDFNPCCMLTTEGELNASKTFFKKLIQRESKKAACGKTALMIII